MDWLNQITIRTRMIAAFTLFLVPLAGFGLFSLSEMQTLGKLTSTLYEHPLKVSNAAIRASMGVIKMHRSMKDLAMSRGETEMHQAMLAVAQEERAVHENLDVIRENILGEAGQELTKRTRKTFMDWKNIRDEVIGLVNRGEKSEAALITRGKGARYVLQLEREMEELTAYARKKADVFMGKAEKVEANILKNTILFIVLVAFLTLVTAYLMARSILSSVTSLKETMAEITKTGTFTRSKITGQNEIAEMATHFNELINRLESQFWLRDGQNSLNRELSGQLSFDELCKKGIRFISRHVGACSGALYTQDREKGTSELRASFALAEGDCFSTRFKNGEGIVGQVAVEKKPILLGNITRKEAVGASGTVSEPPKSIYALPLFYEKDFLGVMEVASFEALTPLKRELLDLAGKILSISLHTAAQGARIKTLFEESKAANQELKQRSEEVNQANEKLTALNDELQAQAQELQTQSDELRVQTTELEAQRLQVQEADRLKSEFLSNMSHELRTPLNSVMALSQLMISRGTGKNPEQETEYLRVIERNGRILLSLINDILDLSKIEAGRMDTYITDFDPSRVVNQAWETVAPLAREKGLDIRVEAAKDLVMRSDEDKVNQILLNLFSNAVKFTEKGRVAVNVRQEGGRISFSVSDTGIGIEQDQLAHIFDEFRQVDGSTTRKYEGTGLGLTICQKLAHLMGGEITVTSRFGEGTVFTLDLPVRPLEEGIESSSQSLARFSRVISEPEREQTATPAPVEPLGPTVLVIDDEEEVRILLENYLREAGYLVVSARDGKEGLELARRLKPFAITLDLIMPETDGWEVLKELKMSEDTREIPVIVVSVSNDRTTGLALGASGYVVKPVDQRTLLAEMRRVSPSQQIRTVLAVDDDPMVLEHLENLLGESGFEVDRASGGREGIARVAADPPDLMILDLMMPEMDGFQVLDQIRSNPDTENLPVLILTAKELSVDDRARLKVSVDRVVSKGTLNQEELLKKIEAVLESLAPERPSRRKGRVPLVLVVEDNEVAALQIQSALENKGYAVHVAPGGGDALAFVRKTIPDGIVLDLMMPEVDGFQVLEEIRSRPETTTLPVLVLTAKELSADDRARLSHNHIQQLIQKGAMDRDQLVVCVEKMLRKAKNGDTPEKKGHDPHPLKYDPVTEGTRNRTILVVEDNPDNVIAITAILDDLEYPHAVARGGREGVKMAARVHPALILMDVQLPVLSGLDATREIKKDPALNRIPVIALTAKAMKGDREKLLTSGFDDYMAKPVEQALLKNLLQKWMDSFDDSN